MSDSAQTASFKQTPEWVKWVLSPAAFILLAGVLAGGWVLAQHDTAAAQPVQGMSWGKLSTQSWFIKAWILNAATLVLPAAGGFAIGWIAHRSSSSALGAAMAAVGVVFVALWPFGEKQEAATYTAPVPVAPAPAAAVAADPTRAHAVPDAKPDPAAPKAGAEDPLELLKAMKQQAEPAEKAAAGEKAVKDVQVAAPAQPQATAKAAPAADALKPRQQAAAPAQPTPVVPMLADRNQMFVQVETNAPPSTAGVMPPPPSMQSDKAQAHPVFPGCRWATPTTWVCDQPKP